MYMHLKEICPKHFEFRTFDLREYRLAPLIDTSYGEKTLLSILRDGGNSPWLKPVRSLNHHRKI